MSPINVILLANEPAETLNIADALQHFNINLIQLSTVEEVFSRADLTSVAALFIDTDLGLPEQYANIFMFAAALKQNDNLRHSPLLFLSSRSLHEIPGFNDFAVSGTLADCVLKPVDSYTLRAKLPLYLDLYRYRTSQKANTESTGQEAWYQIALSSIGDATLATDKEGRISYLNPVAEQLTGWSRDEALGQPLDRIFNIVNEHSRQIVPNPIDRVLGEGIVVGLANHTILIAKDGTETPIADSGAPIRNEDGEVIGAILVFRDVSQEKRVDQLQEHLASIITSSDDAIISKDLNGVITSWNSGAERMYGYTADEMIGTPISVLIPPDWPNDVPRILALIKQGERVAHYETKRMAKDKTVLDVSLSVSPLYDGDGTVIGASKIARDITKQKQSDAALRDAVNFHRKLESQLTILIDASKSLLNSLDPQDVLTNTISLAQTLVNATAYGIWRFDSQDNQWRIAMSTGLSEGFKQVVLGSMGDTTPLDEPFLAEDIELFPRLESRRLAYRDEGIRSVMVIPLFIRGQVSGSIVFYYRQPTHFDELTVRVATALSNIVAAALSSAEVFEEQRQLRAQAETAELRWAFLAEASRILSSSVDYQTVLAHLADLVVPELADWCGIDVPDEEGLIQQVVVKHADPEKVEIAHELRRRYPVEQVPNSGVLRVLQTGKPILVPQITDDMYAVVQDKEYLKFMRALAFESYIVVPLSARGQTIGTLTLATSESHRRYTASDLQLAGELANRAGVVVDNARLYRDAQQAISARDEFLSVAAHELKTPITSLRGFAQTTLRYLARAQEFDKDRIVHVLDSINAQSIKLTQLVAQLLDISRLEAGKLSLERTLTDITPLLHEVAEQAQSLTKTKTVLVEASGEIIALVDKIRLEQVLTNLIDNAVKFSPDGEVVTAKMVADSDTIHITVTDHGIGIPEPLRRNIFERFYQAHPDKFLGGLGLGLYISRQIIDLHGGQIVAEFPPEGGTRMVITLPRNLEGELPHDHL